MVDLRRFARISAACLILIFCTAGCRISTHNKDGKEDVAIDTPLGGLAVKTDPGVVLSRIGLPQYPGSVSVKQKDNDKESADVNLSFGSFHLRVQAAGFQTNDSRDKVEAFYRKALAQYSDVIACENEHPVGEPRKTGLGLTCKSDQHIHTEVHNDDHPNSEHEFVLKAGSPSRQHLVTLESRDNGTRFSLVALDLPKGDDRS